tara:strand:+ start:361 stop:834 length:474 start_codon:yes stop_codon:yes gene_type:complete
MIILAAQALALYVMGCCFGGMMGCTPAIWQDLGDCSVATSVGCASQAVGGCIAPAVNKPGNGWKNYAICLWDQAKVCERDGLAKCALAAAVESTGFPGIGSSGVSSLVMMEARSTGVPFKCEDEQVRACVTDAHIETKSEAINSVAHCYRTLCTGTQ